MHVCAVLDCIISLSLTAREYDWHCPRYVDEAVIDVDDGRHPIAELLSSNKFVANPIRFIFFFHTFRLNFSWESFLKI